MKERKSDILWKMVMDEVFEALLRFVYSDADQVYDLERGGSSWTKNSPTCPCSWLICAFCPVPPPLAFALPPCGPLFA